MSCSSVVENARLAENMQWCARIKEQAPQTDPWVTVIAPRATNFDIANDLDVGRQPASQILVKAVQWSVCHGIAHTSTT